MSSASTGKGSEKQSRNPLETHLIIFTGFLLVFVFTSSAMAQPQPDCVQFGSNRASIVSTNSDMKDETTTGILINFDISGMNVHEIIGVKLEENQGL